MWSSASCDATRDAVAVAASRRSALRVRHGREAVRDLVGDLVEEAVGRAEVGLQLAGDEHAERDAAARRAGSGGRPPAVRPRGPRSVRRRASRPSRRFPAPDTSARSRRSRAAGSSRCRRGSSRSSPARAGTPPPTARRAGCGRRSRRRAAPGCGPGSRRAASSVSSRVAVRPGHASTPSRSAMRSSWPSTSRVTTSKSSGRIRIASSSRSTSGAVG